MEPNKYDTDFRTILNNREITPSADSWNTLDAMLSATPEKKKKPMIWLYIAASILGFLFVGNLFMVQLGGGNDDIQVVIQENSVIVVPLESPQEINANQEEIVVVQSDQQAIKVNESQIALAKVVSPNSNKALKLVEEEVAIESTPPIPQKAIRNLLNDANLEQLLADASSSQKPNSVVKVNAKNLLSQVDGEIELTFREKVIKSVAKNYKEIKVAVSNRNLEEL